MTHPVDTALALLAGGEVGPFRRFSLDRHVRRCVECQKKLAQFHGVRSGLAELEAPELNWDALEAEMRANIHLGFEAGQCVRSTGISRSWSPRPAIAFASLLLLIAASFLLHDTRVERGSNALPAVAGSRSQAAQFPMVQTTAAGIELSSGTASLTLLSHRGATMHQTVSAQGEIRARYVDGETGSVTINNVYLQY